MTKTTNYKKPFTFTIKVCEVEDFFNYLDCTTRSEYKSKLYKWKCQHQFDAKFDTNAVVLKLMKNIRLNLIDSTYNEAAAVFILSANSFSTYWPTEASSYERSTTSEISVQLLQTNLC